LQLSRNPPYNFTVITMPDNNTLGTAPLLALTGIPQTLSGFVGSNDRNDFYKFILDGSSVKSSWNSQI
jgi:hypothetical protein